MVVKFEPPHKKLSILQCTRCQNYAQPSPTGISRPDALSAQDSTSPLNVLERLEMSR